MAMRRRYLYTILFGVPGLLLALLAAFAATAVFGGVLWLYVYGDNPWPEWTGPAVPLAFLLVLLAVWLATLFAGYRFGRSQEGRSGLDRKHVLVSVAATLVPVALMALHQFRVGNLGPRHDSVRCGDYCRERGFAGSGMPPRNSGERTCLCFDSQGREVSRVPLGEPAGGAP